MSSGGEWGGGDLLAFPDKVNADCRLIQRAIKERWQIPPEVRIKIVKRLCEIIDKDKIDVITKVGIVSLEGPADSNAIAAARTLTAMDSLNVREQTKVVEHHHQHEVGPRAAEGIEEYRRRLAEKADSIGIDFRGIGGDRETAERGREQVE